MNKKDDQSQQTLKSETSRSGRSLQFLRVKVKSKKTFSVIGSVSANLNPVLPMGICQPFIIGGIKHKITEQFLTQKLKRRKIMKTKKFLKCAATVLFLIVFAFGCAGRRRSLRRMPRETPCEP